MLICCREIFGNNFELKKVRGKETLLVRAPRCCTERYAGLERNQDLEHKGKNISKSSYLRIRGKGCFEVKRTIFIPLQSIKKKKKKKIIILKFDRLSHGYDT